MTSDKFYHSAWIILLLCFGMVSSTCGQDQNEIFLGSGAKAGEITHHSAIIHVRLTQIPRPNRQMLIPGAKGKARVRYSANKEMNNSDVTELRIIGSVADYSVQFSIDGLLSGRRYYYVIEYCQPESEVFKVSKIHSFLTAPAPDERKKVRFIVTTCQDYRGQSTYAFMSEEQPDFLISAGDNVYYDGAGNAHNVNQAYRAYQKMFGLPLVKRFFRNVGGYFLKDDHDYRFNDADPWSKIPVGFRGEYRPGDIVSGQKWLTHEEGIRVFKEVFPMSEKTYRTFKWGKGVQIWMTEGRDYRNRNNDPDGPEKSMWGAVQKEWLKSTLSRSEADWRIIISPTPIIGPDALTKKDNHANLKGFWTEGQEFLDWLKENNMDNVILICGDRHWQYHSQDLRNNRNVHEFSCGPTCNEHTTKVPKIVKEYKGINQPYTASIGGFLTVNYSEDKSLQFTFNSTEGDALYKKIFKLE